MRAHIKATGKMMSVMGIEYLVCPNVDFWIGNWKYNIKDGARLY